jgi:hypothetical protein
MACEKGVNRLRVPEAAIRCELTGPLIAVRTQILPGPEATGLMAP